MWLSFANGLSAVTLTCKPMLVAVPVMYKGENTSNSTLQKYHIINYTPISSNSAGFVFSSRAERYYEVPKVQREKLLAFLSRQYND